MQSITQNWVISRVHPRSKIWKDYEREWGIPKIKCISGENLTRSGVRSIAWKRYLWLLSYWTMRGQWIPGMRRKCGKTVTAFQASLPNTKSSCKCVLFLIIKLCYVTEVLQHILFNLSTMQNVTVSIHTRWIYINNLWTLKKRNLGFSLLKKQIWIMEILIMEMLLQFYH